MGTRNNLNFFKSKGNSLSKIIQPEPNSNLTCVFGLTHLLSEFQLKKSMHDIDDERKLKKMLEFV